MTNVLGILTDLQANPPVLDPDITRVWTTGTRVEGRAPGVYIHDDSFDLATWPMAGFTDDSDRIFRFDYSSSEFRPGHFGVLGDGTEDDLPAMQDFCDFVTTFSCGNVFLHGTAYLSDTLYFGPAGNGAGPDSATKVFHGTNMNFLAYDGANMDKLVHMRNCKDCYFYPRFLFRGQETGGASGEPYTDRDNVGVGLWLEHCRGAYFRSIHCQRFWYAGVATQKLGTALLNGQEENSNNNFVAIDKLFLQWIGTGDLQGADTSLRATWTSGSAGTRNSGSAGDFDQRTTITLDTAKLPPASIIGSNRDDLGTSLFNQPIFFYIDNEPYRLMSLNWSTGVATIFPWLPSTTGTSGEGVWAWGGGLVINGGDANGIKVGLIDGRIVGVGLAVRSNQGPTIDVLALENDCGIGIVFGDMLTGTNLQGNNTLILSYYSEGPDNHVLWATDFEDDKVSGQIISNMVHEWSDPTSIEAFKRLSPREANDTYTDRTIPNWVIDEEGIRHLKKNHPATSGTHRIDTPQDVEICRSNGPTWTLDADSRVTRLFDYDRQLLLVHGSGPNGGPTGTVTFNAPSGGTVNGLASAAWTGFHGPALFALYESVNDTWFVNLVAGQQRAGREGQYVTASDADQTLTAASYTSRLYTGTLTANRTLTLPTADISSGHEFHVARTGGGAFTLSVGGLKSLAQNTWCITRYDGAAWKLMAYGAL